MKTARLISLCIIAVTLNITAKAQEKGDMALGGYVAVGSGVGYEKGGIGIKFLYNASNRIRLAAEVDYWRNDYWKIYNDYENLHNINVYTHLLPSNSNRTVVFYPFIGIGRESKKSHSFFINNGVKKQNYMHSIAFLFGMGIDIKLSPKITLNSELRVHQSTMLILGGSLNLASGLTYKF